MLLGRGHERQQIDRALAGARSGTSTTLALSGEPGIGKTVLLGYAVQRAAGMRLLRARGIESEAQIPFGALLELIRPALGLLDDIPAPQAAALAGALALRPGTADDRFAVGAATLSLLACYAEQDPVELAADAPDLALALRCQGLLAPDDGFAACFEQALGLHEKTPDAFETARTRLAYGERLRRARNRVLARTQLRAAADTFLSPKTVEYHLRHVYARLGLNSRDQLARALAGQAAGDQERKPGGAS